MNKDLTLVFSSYQSQQLLYKILEQFYKKYKVIVVENSLDRKIKEKIEKKFQNVDVVIPNENLGLARSYNLGIKRSKTKFVFLNNPDMKITDKSIRELLFCAKKIKNFGAISPVFQNEKIYKNYKIFNKKKKINLKFFKKFGIVEVDLLDNNFLISKKNIKKNLFDINFFLFFETLDFTKCLQKSGKKLYAANKIKFNHFGSSSLPKKFDNLVQKTRAFHYNWSKFYYLRKHYNYFYAFRKVVPSIIRAIKKILINIFKFNLKGIQMNFLELLGIFTAIFLVRAFFRPKN